MEHMDNCLHLMVFSNGVDQDVQLSALVIASQLAIPHKLKNKLKK